MTWLCVFCGCRYTANEDRGACDRCAIGVYEAGYPGSWAQRIIRVLAKRITDLERRLSEKESP